VDLCSFSMRSWLRGCVGRGRPAASRHWTVQRRPAAARPDVPYLGLAPLLARSVVAAEDRSQQLSRRFVHGGPPVNEGIPPAVAAATDAPVAAAAGGAEWAVSGEGQLSGSGAGDHVKADRRKVLLHSCCAPCSGAMVETMVEQGHEVTIFFYNPNIHPKAEYEVRKEENKRYARELGVPFVDVDGDVDEWYRRAKGMEFCPERGARCSMCFDMRLERTALHAHEQGFDSFTTTNATSRWKDEAQVNASGFKAAAKYPGIEYWASDWQTEAMSQKKYEINARERFYKQEYCGCTYSLRDSNHWRSKQGIPPIAVAGGGVYSDPTVDEQEESIETVEGFFRDSPAFEAEIRKVYQDRRKGKGRPETDNW